MVRLLLICMEMRNILQELPVVAAVCVHVYVHVYEHECVHAHVYVYDVHICAFV